MLRTILSEKKNINKFSNLTVFMKGKSIRHYSEKSSVFAKPEMEIVLRETDGRTYLRMQVNF